MNTITKVSIVVVLMACAAAGGRYATPTKVQEKEVIKYVDKIVEKKVYVKAKTESKHRVYVRLTTVKPDGTKTTETKIFNSDTIEITQKTNIAKTDEKVVDTSKQKGIEYKSTDYYIFVSAKTDLANMLGLTYGLSFNRKLIGPFYVGAFGYTDKTAGFNLGLGF